MYTCQVTLTVAGEDDFTSTSNPGTIGLRGTFVHFQRRITSVLCILWYSYETSTQIAPLITFLFIFIESTADLMLGNFYSRFCIEYLLGMQQYIDITI